MNEEVKKDSTEHKHHKIRIGALIVVVLLVFILFKVNLRKAVNSPQFNDNVSFIEQKVKGWYERATKLFDGMFKNTLNNGVNQLKTGGGLNFNAPVLVDPNIIENKIGADRIRGYFNAPNDENIDKKFNEVYNPISTPVSN
jgi:predicted membrane-bound dolichyl-phosphate-mannose-protein mannosyltransferase